MDNFEKNRNKGEAGERYGRKEFGRIGAKVIELLKGEKEKLILGVGEVEKSKGMTYEGGRPTACEDAHYFNEEEGIFAVFDGVGGERGGRKASQMAAEGVEDFVRTRRVRGKEDLGKMLEEISGKIAEDPEAGATTATVAKITKEKGKKFLDFAQVGDSRLYIVRGRDAFQATRDEGEGHRIDNWLGDEAPGVTQMNRIPLIPGDKIVLCTDGVTGDYGDERMSNYEIADIVNRAGHEQVAARVLVEEARKHDDRTALVVSV